MIWLILSVSFFVFILPLSSETLIKIMAGYVFYVFIRELFYQEIEYTSSVDERIEVLKNRLEHSPRETSVYVHGDKGGEKKDDVKKKNDLRKFL